MSRKERDRLTVFARVKDRELTRKAGAELLGLSLRQMHRLMVRYRSEGDGGLVHRSRGRASSRRVDSADRERALDLYRGTYRSWGPTHVAEKLGPEHGIWVSHDTVRRWLIEEGLLEKPRRGRRSRRRRLRKERFGQMLQMDGSHHLWFGQKRCCLMVIVDDATGQMLGRFFEGETLLAAMDLFGRWCRQHGIPQSLYVDRAGIYRCERELTTEELLSRSRPQTQFGRAMKELGVRLILARSPQAKGRVERANATLQDRLVKEMSLAGISSIEQANAWLERSGFFAQLNARFGVEPMDSVDAHRPAPLDLAQVLCVKEKRSVSLDGCVQWNGRTLQLVNPRRGLRCVQIWEHLDGRVQVIDGGRELQHQPWTAPPKAHRVFKNNKPHKPGPHQQISLSGSRPRTAPERLRRAG